MESNEAQGEAENQESAQAPDQAAAEAPTAQESAQADQLPDTPDKQQQAFIKMRQALKEKDDRLKQYEAQDGLVDDEIDVINQFRQGAYSPQAPITPETELDEFTQRVSRAEQIAYQSNQRIESLERELEDQRLFSEFPELNPKSEQSKTPQSKAFEEYVAGKAALEILKGQKPDLVSIARKAKESFSGMSSAQRDVISKEVAEEIQTKENATLEAKGSSFVADRKEDFSEVNRRIWRGDMEALAYRLKKRG